jgi:hypothetical protein
VKYLFLFFIVLTGSVKAQSVYDSNIDWSNPSLIAGSNLPAIFQRYYLIGDYNSMIELTSSKSRLKFGDANLINYYQKMDFGYHFKLKNRIINSDGSQSLYAEGIIGATRKRVKFQCVVEGGKSRMAISSISDAGIFPIE